MMTAEVEGRVDKGACTDRTDVVVVGAGPVGLFAAFQCGLLDMRCVVVDALAQPGGQCAALYPDKPIYDIPGFPSIDGRELVGRLARQAAAFAPSYRLGERVTELERDSGEFWRVGTEKGTSLVAPALIIAAGAGSFEPRRPPQLDLASCEGRSVHYAVNDVEAFRNRAVVIAGGGDSAIDWALHLAGIAGRIWLVHRRESFTAAPASERRLRAEVAAGRIELVTPFQLCAVESADGGLKTVSVQDFSGVRRDLPADRLLLCFGLAQDLGPLARWGLRLEKRQIVVDPATCETSLPGVYAIGDIAAYPGKRKLILCGFSEAAMAAAAAFRRVHPDRVVPHEHSTSRGLRRSDAVATAGGAQC